MFKDYNFKEFINKGLDSIGFVEETDIQKEVISRALRGENIIGKRVSVVFNHREVVGYVLDTSFSDSSKEELEQEYGFKLSYINKVIDTEALLNEELLDVASAQEIAK